jgi:hypothetical protein
LLGIVGIVGLDAASFKTRTAGADGRITLAKRKPQWEFGM